MSDDTIPASAASQGSKPTTYGALFSALKPFLNESAETSYDAHFGTKSYFIERDLAHHRAFDRFCLSIGLDAAETAAMRKKLIDHASKDHQFMSAPFRAFAESLPHAFNVRGVWTSERMSMSMSPSVGVRIRP